MRLIVIGPGRAGGALAIASQRAGHELVGVLARTPQTRWPQLEWEEPLPDADVALVAVSDAAIEDVATRLAPVADRVGVVAHLSGFAPVTRLNALRAGESAIGGFHPLVALSSPEAGADALTGSFAGVGGDPLAIDALTHLAETLGMNPFEITDDDRPAYHAAAAAASNFVVTALGVSAALFQAAHVRAEVSRPLVEKTVAAVFERGAEAVLTGPIARGDIETVVGHLAAAHEVSPEIGDRFRLMAEATSIQAGRREDSERWR